MGLKHLLSSRLYFKAERPRRLYSAAKYRHLLSGCRLPITRQSRGLTEDRSRWLRSRLASCVTRLRQSRFRIGQQTRRCRVTRACSREAQAKLRTISGAAASVHAKKQNQSYKRERQAHPATRLSHLTVGTKTFPMNPSPDQETRRISSMVFRPREPRA